MKTRNLMLSLMAVMVLVAASSMVYAKDVGVLWMGQSGMPTRVFTGFEEGMKEFAPDVNLEVKKELSKTKARPSTRSSKRARTRLYFYAQAVPSTWARTLLRFLDFSVPAITL